MGTPLAYDSTTKAAARALGLRTQIICEYDGLARRLGAQSYHPLVPEGLIEATPGGRDMGATLRKGNASTTL